MNGTTKRRIDRLGARLDAHDRHAGIVDGWAMRVAERETAGLTEDEIDGLTAQRLALLDEIDAKTRKANP